VSRVDEVAIGRSRDREKNPTGKVSELTSHRVSGIRESHDQTSTREGASADPPKGRREGRSERNCGVQISRKGNRRVVQLFGLRKEKVLVRAIVLQGVQLCNRYGI
jgi:hypothetical protein